MNNLEISYTNFCGVALELIEQLTALIEILKSDAETLKQFENNTHIRMLFELHASYLEKILMNNLEKMNEIMKSSVKS